MIELDDPITNINLGLDEYVVLKALEVMTIRQLLLLDVDRILALRMYDYRLRERLGTWQKLLRKYLTYEKLHAAREREELVEEEMKIFNPVSKDGINAKEVKILKDAGITTILEYLDADLEQVFKKKGIDKKTLNRLIDAQEKLSNKELLEASLDVTILEEYTGHSMTRVFEPEKTVTDDDFLNEPVSESRVNPNELEVLESLKIETVRDFLGLDIDRVKEVKGYSEKIYLRLVSWQKYYRKRLGWESDQ